MVTSSLGFDIAKGPLEPAGLNGQKSIRRAELFVSLLYLHANADP
jgi:hypothetical protein